MTAPNHSRPTSSAGALTQLARSRYASLRTFRRSGDPVDTAVWFVVEGDCLWFRTPTDAAKARRIAHDPNVEIRPCTWKGLPTGQPVPGTGRILDREAAVAPERRLAERYGWQWNTVPLLRVPGTGTVRHDGGLRDKIRLARARTLWADSCIVEVRFQQD